MDLTKSLFQFCFSFTMKQKLAPLWNKAGEFLVQGMVNVYLKDGVKRETRPGNKVPIYHASSLKRITKCV